MRFMMIHYIDESVLTRDENGEEIEDPEEARIREAWDTEMKERGVHVGGGVLDRPAKTTTVRVRDGKVLVTDGPFAETKDLIAGWMIIDVDSYDRAIELAGALSAAPGANGEPIHEWLEVRPFLAAPPAVTE